MGKSERQQAEDMTKQNYSRVNQQGQQTQDMLHGMLPDAQKRGEETYDAASGAYKSFTGGMGSFDPGEYKRIQDQNQQNTSTGGYDPGRVQQLRDQNTSNVKTGGFDPGQVSKITSDYGDLTSKGMGGINGGSADNIRAGYNKLATSGGIDENTADAMRRQTASGVASVYSTLGSNLARKQAAQGFGGGGGETAQLARQLGNTQAEAVTGVNAEIGKLRQTGTIAGLGGLSEFEQGAASGQRAAITSEAGFEGDQAKNRLAAQGQSQELEASKAHNTLQSTQAQQDLAAGAAGQRIAAAGGIASLYSASPGYVTSLVQSILQSQSVNGTLSTEQSQIMQELSKQPGIFGNIMSSIGTIGGAAAGVLGGLGKIGVGGGGKG